jgi:hypothetical protein
LGSGAKYADGRVFCYGRSDGFGVPHFCLEIGQQSCESGAELTGASANSFRPSNSSPFAPNPRRGSAEIDPDESNPLKILLINAAHNYSNL